MGPSIYWRSILPYFVNHIENEIFLHLTNLFLKVYFERRLSRPKEHQRASKDLAWQTRRDNGTCQATKLLKSLDENEKQQRSIRKQCFYTDKKTVHSLYLISIIRI